LRNSQFRNRLLYLLATVRPIPGSRPESTFQLHLPINPPACVGDLSSALPSNPTTDPYRLSDRSTCHQLNLQLALAIKPSARLPANHRLASPTGFLAQPPHQPAACAACRPFGLPSDSSPACAFDLPSGQPSD